MIKLFGVISLILLFGCSASYKTLKMNKQNPTEYVFDSPISKVSNIAKKELKYFKYDWKSSGMELYDFRDSDSAFQAKYAEDIEVINSEYDLLLADYLGGSRTFVYSDTNSVIYEASFLIHFEELNKNKTKVKVYTLNPRILTFSYNILTALTKVHEGVSDDETPVKPSTIEEYEILLKIGEALGVKDQMPPLVLPEK